MIDCFISFVFEVLKRKVRSFRMIAAEHFWFDAKDSERERKMEGVAERDGEPEQRSAVCDSGKYLEAQTSVSCQDRLIC